jgi:hypothetical protein
LTVKITITRHRFIAVMLGTGLITLSMTVAGQPGLSTQQLTLLIDRLAPAIDTLV